MAPAKRQRGASAGGNAAAAGEAKQAKTAHGLQAHGGPLASGTVKFTVSKLSTLADDEEKTSDLVTIGNLPWRLSVQTECKPLDNVKCLGVYVQCNPDSESTIWSCDASFELRLQSQSDGSIPDMVKGVTEINRFSFGTRGLGTPFFIKWADLLNPERGFIKDDQITLIANISIHKITGVRMSGMSRTFDFADSSNALNDCVLLVDGNRLHVSKAYLSLYSPVFKAMFYGQFREGNQCEVPLEDTALDEFTELLHVIYPAHKPINGENVEFLLALGDKFEIEWVIDACEAYLVKADDIPIISKLLWAEQYCLSELHNQCIGTFKSLKDVKQLQHTSKWRELGDTTKVALLEKVCKE